ncbi:MAG TPA: hypothetical protein VGF30_00260 [Bacteroidia bacterium]
MRLADSINALIRKHTFWFSVLLCFIISSAEILIDKIGGDGNGEISNRLVHYAFTLLFFVCLIPAILTISVTFPSLWNRITAKLERAATARMSAKALGLFRIVFFLVALKLILSASEIYSISNYDKTAEQLKNISYLYYIEISMLVLIILGIGGKIPYIFNFLFGSTFLHGDVGTEMFNLVSFWSVFMGLDSAYCFRFKIKNKALNVLFNYRSLPLAWPVIFMGIHLAYTISTAGISKILDGVWDHHMGFYYTFMQPWLRGNTFDFALNYKWLMVLMNWLTIISEVIALPLLLFKRTRLAGGINLLFMFLLLTFPFRIDAIGPFGILIALVVIAAERTRKESVMADEEAQEVSFWPAYLNKAGLVLFIAWTFFSIYFDVLNTINSGRINYPMVAKPFVSVDKKVTKQVPDVFRLPFLNSLSPKAPITWINNKLLFKASPKWYAPFNYWHFTGRVYYKVGVEQNGQLIEPVKVFNEDGTMNTTSYSGGVLQERVVQNRMWLLGVVAHRLARGEALDSLTATEKKQLLAFAEFFGRKAKELGYGNKELIIQVRYITIPEEFSGDVKPWLNEPWYTMLKYNPLTQKIEMVERPLPYTSIPASIKNKIRL